MTNLTTVVFFSLIGGVFSLVGGLLLISNKNSAKKLAKYATPFAAGALLAAAFIDVLPEANHQGDIEKALAWAMIGIVFFFLLERFLHWFHHHHEHDNKGIDPNVSLVVIGDTLHNFIDGIAIAAGFLVNIETGVIVTIAVAAHEIPQEIGDFGLLLKKGMKKRRVILVNVVSALATTVGAVIFFQLGQDRDLSLDILLGVVAGFFIYIAVSDIIPSIHKSEEKVIAGPQTVMLLVGVVFVSLLTSYLHNYIGAEDHDHDHDHHNHDSHIHDSETIDTEIDVLIPEQRNL